MTTPNPNPAAPPAAPAVAPTAPPAPPAAPDPSTVLQKGGEGNFDWLPEKVRVFKEDKTLDLDASARKLAENNSQLEKRLGSGDVAPKEAKDYKITVPEEFKDSWNPAEDELFQEALADMHAAGFTQKQMDVAVNRWLKSAAVMANAASYTPEEAREELSQVEGWKSEAEFKASAAAAHRAFVAFAPEGADMSDPAVGNNPVVMQILAAVGREMQEDKSIEAALPAGVDFDERIQQITDELQKLPPHDKRRVKLLEEKRKLFEAKHGKKPRAMGGSVTTKAA